MKHIFRNLILLAISVCLTQGVLNAEDFKGGQKKKTTTVRYKDDAVDRCRRAQGSAELSINNVRCRINTYGNMWYDGSNAKYFVPKDGNSTPLYAAALWIAGNDVNDQLRVAALRFGSEGDDFWPGPLSADGDANVNKSVCDEWDKIYRVTRTEVERFIGGFQKDAAGNVVQVDESLATEVIRNWPWQGSKDYQTAHLAPFYDQDGDGRYDWTKGDYPYYDFDGSLCPAAKKAKLKPGEPYVPDTTLESRVGGTGNKQDVYGGLLVDQVLKGDETLWWVFNDKGNAHTESGSEYPIGLEIRAQAFAFATNDEINNMTFYSYEIINRSTYTLRETYFSQWVDADLGYAYDDYVGCDVERGLGYCYNGKAIDGPGTGAYTGNPPAVGIDFFQGPYMDPDGKDNPKVDTMKMKEVYPGKLDKYRDTTGKVNVIMLTDDAEEYKMAWYARPDDPVGSCAINGVNFGNGIVDDERFGMRRFVYYNNSLDPRIGEPSKASDYYYYLRGKWKDGSTMRFGGNGHYTDPKAKANIECDFMFPGTTDIWNWGTRGVDPGFPDPRGWTEESSNNAPGDRRFMQSAGPFTLAPGAINYITVGIPFAQAVTGGPYASVKLLQQIDDKCQALFDNCFNVLEGPDAPELTIQEMDRTIILYLTNETGNNVNESYKMLDYSIPRNYPDPGDTTGTKTIDYDRYYRFEGYQIYQLRDAKVSVADLNNPDKARLVAQCDIENYYDSTAKTRPIAKLVNYESNEEIGGFIPSIKVEGLNKGIRHTFKVTEDQFAPKNDRELVNNKKYYYMAIAYAHNNYKNYSPDPSGYDGQKEPYLPSRKSSSGGQITSVCAIPHKTQPEQGGTIVQSYYGVSPEFTRIEGFGNGGISVEWKQESIDRLMGAKGVEPTINFIENPVYQINHGPLNVKVIDPLNLKSGKYNIKLKPDNVGDPIDSCYWILENVDPSKPVARVNGQDVFSIKSPTKIGVNNEVIVFDLGISITCVNPENIVSALTSARSDMPYGSVISGSLLSSSFTFEDPTKAWLTGVADGDGAEYTDWILSGGQFNSEEADNEFLSGGGGTLNSYLRQDYFFFDKKNTTPANTPGKTGIDNRGEFEKVAGGWWAPYRLTSKAPDMPGFLRYFFVSPDNKSVNGEKYVRGFAAMTYVVGTGNNSSTPGVFQMPADVEYNNMNNLASVDIVFTNDQSKWTRCPVIEMGTNPEVTEGNARKFQLRKHASVDKNGNPDGSGTGMGWFPGYAINLETGERLNIIFGEDSELGKYNGRDMIWNPTSDMYDGSYLYGGKHYIYIVGNNKTKYSNYTVQSTAYDRGQWAYDRLRVLDRVQVTGLMSGAAERKRNQQFDSVMHLFANVMWVGMPLSNGKYDITNPNNIPTDAKVSIRVRKPYRKNYYNNADGNELNSPALNDNYPMYQFEITSNLATSKGVTTAGEEALDLITVVPNPYYAASAYETYQVENLVKITNLPPECYITIYTVDGTVVRKLRGPSASLVSGGGTALTSVDWDLKNHNGLPISGGVYLIHVYAPGIGEKMVKWFGALRPIDLNSFQ